jgi:hypothetical protein
MTKFMDPLEDACTPDKCIREHTCRVFEPHNETVSPDNVEIHSRDGEVMLHIGAHSNYSHNQCASVIMSPQEACDIAYGMLAKSIDSMASLCDSPQALAALMDTMMRDAYANLYRAAYGEENPYQ